MFVIGQYSNFLFFNCNGTLNVASNYETMFCNHIKKYNSKNKEHLPKVTSHVVCHTFCTRLTNARINSKTLQYVMGHSNITITLKLYIHVSPETLIAEL